MEHRFANDYVRCRLFADIRPGQAVQSEKKIIQLLNWIRQKENEHLLRLLYPTLIVAHSNSSCHDSIQRPIAAVKYVWNLRRVMQPSYRCNLKCWPHW